VTFPDTDQEKAVRFILGTMGSPESVKLNELAAVTELAIVGNLYAPDIEHTVFTHQGECLVNGIRANEGKVSNLSVIGKMAFLERLALVNQPLNSVNRLNGLVMLQELYLSGDRSLTSLTSLTDLPRLERLHIEHSGIRDLSPLGQLRSLKTVTVSADMLPLTLPEKCAFTVVLVP
jgi:Leucine-rich repeat (LRR) protein